MGPTGAAPFAAEKGFPVSIRGVALSLSVLGCALLISPFPKARGQNVISASAGLVLYSEGRVFLDDAPLLFDPAHFVHVQQGQRLRAGRGRVELMLVPDTLLRLDSGAEVEMISGSLSDARVRLLSGSCTIEVRRTFPSGNGEVLVRGAVVRFDKKGLYRLRNPRRQAPWIKVFRGRATVTAPAFRSTLKAKRSLLLAKGMEQPPIEKLDPLELALLDEWVRVGDTGRRIGTIGQGDQSDQAVLSTKLDCEAGGSCRVPGLDCVLPPVVARRTLSFNGPRFSRLQIR